MRYLVEEIGVDAIRTMIKHPLRGLNICRLSWMSLYKTFQNCMMVLIILKKPHTLQDLVSATGATVIQYESSCCGGGTLGAREKSP